MKGSPRDGEGAGELRWILLVAATTAVGLSVWFLGTLVVNEAYADSAAGRRSRYADRATFTMLIVTGIAILVGGPALASHRSDHRAGWLGATLLALAAAAVGATWVFWITVF